MVIRFEPPDDAGELALYLDRLGCSVAAGSDGRLHVRVRYPETVSDEIEALQEWCAAWAGRSSRRLVELEQSDELATGSVGTELSAVR